MGWRDSTVGVDLEFDPEHIARHGSVDFHHFDYLSQALAQLARGYERDMSDLASMVELGLVDASRLVAAFEQISAQLLRYPGLDATAFERRVRSFARDLDA